MQRYVAHLIDTVLEIATPEHLAFRTRIAGPGRRFIAWVIDFIAWLIILFLTLVVIGMVGGNAGGLGVGLTFLVAFFLYWFYYVVCETMMGGRSPGKLVMKLRVVRPDGLPITFRESALRTLLRAADIIFFPPHLVLVAPLIMALDSKFRRLGDMVAGTMVVIEDFSRITNTAQIPDDPQLRSELPGRLPLDRDDLEALELLVSRPHMSEARRRELADKVAPIYARRLSLPIPYDSARFLATLYARSQDQTRRTPL